MATLTGQTVAATYSLLLKVNDTGIDGTLRTIQDGDATDTALELSTGAIKSTGTLTVDGISTLTGAVAATAGVTGALDGIVGGTTPAAVTGTTIIGTTIDGVIGSVTPAAITGTVITGSTSIDGVVGSVTPAAITGTLITATTNFAGDITGDVTGDTTGTVTAASVLADGVTATTQTASDDSTKVATTAYVDALTTVPAGAITQYGAASAPTGWLLCDGTAKSRTTYSALFAIVSTTYGTGDGSTTFNLPDLQGNVAVGKDSSTFSTLGDTGGVETHALTEDEMPTHKHRLCVNDDVHSEYLTDNLESNLTASGGSTGDHGYYLSSSTATPDCGYVGEKGGDSAHTNLQPYIVLNYIIKT